MIIRKRIDLEGIVQGVGFRPYVFRLATDRKLAGVISNTSSGVTVEIEGSAEVVEDFVSRLPQEPPPLARIVQLEVTDIACRGDADFRILPSRRDEHVRTLISADVATCADCLGELVRPGGQAIRLSFHQLHQLRAALHHRPRHSLRPAIYLYGGVPHVRGVSTGI